MKKNKISKNWINKQKKDIYIRRSKLEGYRSRAVYKLKEIHEKYKIFENGSSVIDLGAAPGSWSQYLVKNFKNIKVASIDLKNMENIKNVFFIKGDFTNNLYQKQISQYFKEKVDVVISDMAANTTGNKNLDSIVTGELCIESMKFAKERLKRNGQFVSKLFMGSTFNEILKFSKGIFKETKIFKPPASRKDSKESFLISKFLR